MIFFHFFFKNSNDSNENFDNYFTLYGNLCVQWDQHRKAGIQETAEIDQETAICDFFQFEQNS